MTGMHFHILFLDLNFPKGTLSDFLGVTTNVTIRAKTLMVLQSSWSGIHYILINTWLWFYLKFF